MALPNSSGARQASTVELWSDDFTFAYLDVEHPPIAWLAYRGVLNSCDVASANPGNLSWFLLDVIKRGLTSTLRREGVLEGFRLRDFSHAAPRLRCVYAYLSLDMAQRGDYGRGKFRKDNLVAIAPSTAHFKMGLHDQNWVTDFDSLPLETAWRYWAGEQTDSPMTECLLQGSFWVLGTAVRKRAYETLKNRYPNSLAMLELSRLAVEFGSDLGSISPWLVKDGDKARVTHIIRYSEEEGVDIFRKAIEKSKCDQTFAVNWVDLEPLCKGGINPELDQKFSVPDLRVFDHELRQDKVAELQDFVGLILRS